MSRAPSAARAHHRSFFFSESTIRVVFDTVSPHSEDPPAQALPPHEIVNATRSLRSYPQVQQLQYAGVDLSDTASWQACVDAVGDVENSDMRSITFIGISLKSGAISKKKIYIALGNKSNGNLYYLLVVS